MNLVNVVATDLHGLMGLDNKVPWRHAKDLAHFRKLTSQGIVIMGRKTYDSVGRSLSNRTNIILSRSPNYKLTYDGLTTTFNTDLDGCKRYLAARGGTSSVFVIGGQEIFNLFEEQVTEAYVTVVETKVPVDTKLNPRYHHLDYYRDWDQISRTELESSEGDTVSKAAVFHMKRKVAN